MRRACRVDKLAKAELAAQKRAVVEAQKQAVRDRKAARQAAKDAKAKAKAEAIAAVAEKARLEAMARAGFRTPEQIAKAKSIKQLFRSVQQPLAASTHACNHATAQSADTSTHRFPHAGSLPTVSSARSTRTGPGMWTWKSCAAAWRPSDWTQRTLSLSR